MNLASVYGITRKGETKHIAFGDSKKMENIWANRNPDKFAKIGIFTSRGLTRTRNVSVQPKSGE